MRTNKRTNCGLHGDWIERDPLYKTQRLSEREKNLPFGTVSLSTDGLTDIIKQAHSEYLLTLIMPTTTAICMFYLSIWYRNCAHNMHIGLFYAKGKQSTYAQQNFTHSNIQQRCANQRIILKKDAVKREELHMKLDSVINVNDGTQGFSGKSNRARLLSWLQKWDNAPTKRWKQFENCASKSTANDKNTKANCIFRLILSFFSLLLRWLRTLHLLCCRLFFNHY